MLTFESETMSNWSLMYLLRTHVCSKICSIGLDSIHWKEKWQCQSGKYLDLLRNLLREENYKTVFETAMFPGSENRHCNLCLWFVSPPATGQERHSYVKGDSEVGENKTKINK